MSGHTWWRLIRTRGKPKNWCKLPLLRSLPNQWPRQKATKMLHRLAVVVPILPAPSTSNKAHLLWDAGPRYKLDDVVPTLPYTTGDVTQHLSLPNEARSIIHMKHQLRTECFAYLSHTSWSTHALGASLRWLQNFSLSLHRTCKRETLSAFKPLRPHQQQQSHSPLQPCS